MSKPPRTSADWVLCGVSGPWGVRVFASDRLTDAQLDIESKVINERAWRLGYEKPVTADTITLTVVMDKYVMVAAPTYEEALQGLFQTWKPTRQQQAELTSAAPPEITA